jgi:hypothetical protein
MTTPQEDVALEQSTVAMEHKLWHGRAVPVGGGAAAGALAGAAIGLLGGPPGAAIGAAVGAALGAGAGAIMRRTDGSADARDAKLDRELGVYGGDIGSPSLSHPPERSADPHRPTSADERADAELLEDGLCLEDTVVPR